MVSCKELSNEGEEPRKKKDELKLCPFCDERSLATYLSNAKKAQEHDS